MLAQIGAPLDYTMTIARFLINRLQVLKLDNIVYTEYDISPLTSVPQGSHLGPTIFILVLRMLPQLIPPGVEILLYADDIVLMSTIRTTDDELNLQHSLDIIAADLQQHNLHINTTKTTHSFHKRPASAIPADYTHDGSPIEQTRSITYLGLRITESMSFNEHIANTRQDNNFGVSSNKDCPLFQLTTPR